MSKKSGNKKFSNRETYDSTATGNGTTRRDFIGNTLIGSGVALLAANAPITAMGMDAGGPVDFKLGNTMSAPLTGLDSSWTGYGGVGDYATANGDTHKVINAAHTLRNDDFSDRVRNVKDTGEEFDLVVAGSGFAGCTAAYTYLKAKPDAKILLLDNNDMFGGVARHNEFEVDGYKLWAPAGSSGIPTPLEAMEKLGLHTPLWDELGLPAKFEAFQGARNSKVGVPFENGGGWETADMGWHFKGHPLAVNPWLNGFKDAPLDEKTKNNIMQLELFRDPPKRADYKEWLDSMTYKEFLINVMGLDYPSIEKYLLNSFATIGCGLGPDVISAYQAITYQQPGVRHYQRIENGVAPESIHLATLPGGNAGVLRHIVRKLIPGIFGKADTLGEVMFNPIDHSLLDKPGSPVRIRLGSLVVNVEHAGSVKRAKHVNVTYLNDDRMHRIKAAQVVLGGAQYMNKRIVTDLPKAHRQAMDSFMHAPVMIVNVAVRNWKFLDKLGVSIVSWFDDEDALGSATLLRTPPLLDGKETMPLEPDKPTVLPIYCCFPVPGLPIEKQAVAARMKMFSMSYADIEKKVRKQFTEMFAAGGFDADRDIAGIVANRHGHGYLAIPPGFHFPKDGRPSPGDVIRQPHGRITFANTELTGHQMWALATVEGQRAAEQLLSQLA